MINVRKREQYYFNKTSYFSSCSSMKTSFEEAENRAEKKTLEIRSLTKEFEAKNSFMFKTEGTSKFKLYSHNPKLRMYARDSPRRLATPTKDEEEPQRFSHFVKGSRMIMNTSESKQKTLRSQFRYSDKKNRIGVIPRFSINQSPKKALHSSMIRKKIVSSSNQSLSRQSIKTNRSSKCSIAVLRMRRGDGKSVHHKVNMKKRKRSYLHLKQWQLSAPEISTTVKVLSQIRFIDYIKRNFEEVKLFRTFSNNNKEQDVLIVECEGVLFKTINRFYDDESPRFLYNKWITELFSSMGHLKNIYLVIPESWGYYTVNSVLQWIKNSKIKGVFKYNDSSIKYNDYSRIGHELGFKNSQKITFLKACPYEISHSTLDEMIKYTPDLFYSIIDFIPSKNNHKKRTILIKDILFCESQDMATNESGSTSIILHPEPNTREALSDYFLGRHLKKRMHLLDERRRSKITSEFITHRNVEVRTLFRTNQQDELDKADVITKNKGLEMKQHIVY